MFWIQQELCENCRYIHCISRLDSSQLTSTCYSEPDHEVGGAETSWGFDGHFEEKSHMGMVEAYGKRWHVGDVVGVFLDLVDRTIRCVIGNHEFWLIIVV